MRCKSCDVLLTDFEATRKSGETKDYIELCNHCCEASGDFFTFDRRDLMHSSDEKNDLEFDQLDEHDYNCLGVTEIFYDL